MEIIAVILVLLGVLSMGAHATLQTLLLKKHKALSKEEVLVAQHAIGAVFLLLSVPFLVKDLSFLSSKVFWLAIGGTTIANIVIQWSNAKSRQVGDLTLVTPIQGLTPGLVAVAAVVLGEFPSAQGILGIGLIMACVWIHGAGEVPLSAKNAGVARHLAHYLRPLRWLSVPTDIDRYSKEEQEAIRTRVTALRFGYLSASFGTAGLLSDGLISRNGNVAIGYLVSYSLLALVFSAMNKRGRSADKTVRGPLNPKVRWLLVAMGSAYALHALFIMSAFRFAPVAYIGSLKRLSIIVTMLFAIWFLKEKSGKRRLWPAIGITLGGMLLATDGTTHFLIEKIG